MPTTFDKLAARAQKFGFSLVKRENFNSKEEAEAAKMEAKASTGMNKTLQICYGIRSIRNACVFFFSLNAVRSFLKEQKNTSMLFSFDVTAIAVTRVMIRAKSEEEAKDKISGEIVRQINKDELQLDIEVHGSYFEKK